MHTLCQQICYRWAGLRVCVFTTVSNLTPDSFYLLILFNYIRKKSYPN